MSKVLIVLNPKLNGSNQNNSVIFSPLPDDVGLPFPLYLNIYWRFLLAALFLLALVQGSKLRKLIVVFITSPETKVGPINSLVIMAQRHRLHVVTNSNYPPESDHAFVFISMHCLPSYLTLCIYCK